MRGYKFAINWIVNHDDVTNLSFTGTPTMALVADLFQKTDEKVMEDVKRVVEKNGNPI